MTDREQRLKEIEERAKAATEGPWRYEFNSGLTSEGVRYTDREHVWGPRIGINVAPNGDWFTHDLVFIASARQDLPWLISELRKADAKIEVAKKALRESLDWHRRWHGRATEERTRQTLKELE